ncbi:hypothetical protein FPSE_06106 [Fusarium pseudograminearum CS3096]|uniref:Bacterial alpha-L-rhamnosidase N-terminal domain-containing protein n=1 Tax=Fusarium pseudograminearum (strain CS3096) TaxID=1028729 RepID=K3VH48_FUSPC|nr:hypothetical protein FPSE_06106 [Fusarium pseudograminearum CS3096]EKJ73712.1 hypothetical protein FPSE_06106 [Fusarium pseudograminearum CS3096]
MALTISRVSFEHYRTALGIAETEPRISWRFDGDVTNWEQSSYDIEVTRSVNDEPKSFSFNSSDSLYLPWPDTPLDEAELAHLRVRAHGLATSDQPSTPWSDWVSVETSLSKKGWENVKPIASTIKVNVSEPKRPVYFRKDFAVPDSFESARLYITALGIYEAEINGKRVGDHVLAPGWQSYHHRHVYDTYDVTDLITPGANAIGALVGEGWYVGRLGFGGGQRNIYGNSTGLLAQLHIKSKNGTVSKVYTDTTWKSGFGPVVNGEIYDGEYYDGNLESDVEGWSEPGFDDASWHDTRILPAVHEVLVPPDQPPTRRIQEVKPKEFFALPSGKQLVDFS